MPPPAGALGQEVLGPCAAPAPPLKAPPSTSTRPPCEPPGASAAAGEVQGEEETPTRGVTARVLSRSARSPAEVRPPPRGFGPRSGTWAEHPVALWHARTPSPGAGSPRGPAGSGRGHPGQGNSSRRHAELLRNSWREASGWERVAGWDPKHQSETCCWGKESSRLGLTLSEMIRYRDKRPLFFFFC